MKICRCGEKLVTSEQLRTGWCSRTCQQKNTPRQPFEREQLALIDTTISGRTSVTLRTPNANPRDHKG